jgi:putative Ca2+/H+ antiporter (TMEM165/GDT1 family)
MIKLRHAHSIVALGMLAAIIGHMIQNLFELAEIVDTISILLFVIFGLACSSEVRDSSLHTNTPLHGKV